MAQFLTILENAENVAGVAQVGYAGFRSFMDMRDAYNLENNMCVENNKLREHQEYLRESLDRRTSTDADFDKILEISREWIVNARNIRGEAAYQRKSFVTKYTVYLFCLALITILLFLAIERKNDKLYKLYGKIDRLSSR